VLTTPIQLIDISVLLLPCVIPVGLFQPIGTQPLYSQIGTATRLKVPQICNFQVACEACFFNQNCGVAPVTALIHIMQGNPNQ
jgi:hypothetical protein